MDVVKEKVLEHANKCIPLGQMIAHASRRERSAINTKTTMNMRTGEPTGYAVTYDLGKDTGLLKFQFCPFCGVSFL